MARGSICAHSYIHTQDNTPGQPWSCLLFVVVPCDVGCLPVVSWCLCGHVAHWSLILLLALSLHSQCLLRTGVGCYVIFLVCLKWFLRPCVGRSRFPHPNLHSLCWRVQTLQTHAHTHNTHTARTVSFGGILLFKSFPTPKKFQLYLESSAQVIKFNDFLVVF